MSHQSTEAAENTNHLENTSNKNKLGKFNRFILWLNYLGLIGISFSFLSQHINPENFWIFSFFGLSYPIWLLINLLFFIYWLVQLKWPMILSLFFILLGWKLFFSYLQPGSPKKNSEGDIKIMSYNCMLFNLYNWNENESTRKKIFELLKTEKPDILCLQEFYNSEDAKDFHNIDSLKKIFKDYSIHVEYSHTIRKNDHWGIITLSKFPIIGKGKINFNTKWNNLCIYSDLLMNGDTVRLYNTHLASIHFGKKEHTFINDIINNKETDQIEGSKGILRLLKQGFQRRANQVQLIKSNKENCPYPVIICGDFNDPPCSYAYYQLSNGLNDAFLESGAGLGRTYSGKLPTFRIDYILHSPIFESSQYTELRKPYTDHFPVSCRLRKLSR